MTTNCKIRSKTTPQKRPLRSASSLNGDRINLYHPETDSDPALQPSYETKTSLTDPSTITGEISGLAASKARETKRLQSKK